MKKDDFWNKEDGEFTRGNWFMEHPKTTISFLLSVVVVIVLITI